jgi:hypothetical protein
MALLHSRRLAEYPEAEWEQYLAEMAVAAPSIGNCL